MKTEDQGIYLTRIPLPVLDYAFWHSIWIYDNRKPVNLNRHEKISILDTSYTLHLG